MRTTENESLAAEAEGHLARAREHLLARRIPECLACLAEAERAGADPNTCAGDRWQCYMLLGQWERAWRESDGIRARGAEDPHRFWDGTPWSGKRVMLRCLHGIGDAIQFIRYAPRLRREAAALTVETSPHLAELMRFFPGPDRVISWGPTPPPEPAWDVQMEIMELPYLFRATPATVPNAVPYLRLPPAQVAAAGMRMDRSGRPRVGLVWAGGEWNRSRCIPLLDFLPLLRQRGVVFYSLQGGADSAEWATLRDRHGLEEAADHGEGLVALASVVANLDLVITIDTMAAHLAGALAKPVWLLLQHSADWRWMLEREDSPWYPTMRIFRQRREQDREGWRAVICELETRLAAWTRERAVTIRRDATLGRV